MSKFIKMLGMAFEAYRKNIKLVSFSVVPFLVAFPVALMLPNYAALGSIFLRMDSIRFDLTLLETAVIVGLPLLSMLFFSFALVAINMIITSQRALTRITFYEFERIEHRTFQLFEIFLVGFALSFGIDLGLYQYGLHPTIGALCSAIIAGALLFVPQAVVVDGITGVNAVKRSIKTITRHLPHTIMFLAFSAFLIVLNDGVFIQLSANPAMFMFARYAAIIVNAMVILPFLEVLKVQLYLEKYTIL